MEERGFFELDIRLSELSQRSQRQDPRAVEALDAELEVGWIYHDHALEGVVLSRQEIRAALAGTPIVDDRAGALYETIREYKAAIDLIKDLGRTQLRSPSKRGLITVTLLKQLHELLTPEDKQKGSPYRKGAPPHRAYHHSIATPDSIPARMRRLCESLDEMPDSTHLLTWVAAAHFEFMSIYPWLRNNGQVARLLMNLLLLRAGYPPAIISGGERQRYYESLHTENGRLASLIIDALTTYWMSANQFFDELAV